MEELHAKHALTSLVSKDLTDSDVDVILESQRQRKHLASTVATLKDAASAVEVSHREHKAKLVGVNLGLIEQMKGLRTTIAKLRVQVRNWPFEHGAEPGSSFKQRGGQQPQQQQQPAGLSLPAVASSDASGQQHQNSPTLTTTARHRRLEVSPIRLPPRAAAAAAASPKVLKGITGARSSNSNARTCNTTDSRRRASLEAESASARTSNISDDSQLQLQRHYITTLVKPLQAASSSNSSYPPIALSPSQRRSHSTSCRVFKGSTLSTAARNAAGRSGGSGGGDRKQVSGLT